MRHKGSTRNGLDSHSLVETTPETMRPNATKLETSEVTEPEEPFPRSGDGPDQDHNPAVAARDRRGCLAPGCQGSPARNRRDGSATAEEVDQLTGAPYGRPVPLRVLAGRAGWEMSSIGSPELDRSETKRCLDSRVSRAGH